MGRKLSESELLNTVCHEIRAGVRVTKKCHDTLAQVFRDRYEKASKAVADGRVRKYVFKSSGRVIWTVRGNKAEYQVIPAVGFCACADFYYRLRDGAHHLCYHLLAQRLAEMLDKFETVSQADDALQIVRGGLVAKKGLSR